MSFDLSRKKFNPLDNYFGVVMQQGRVQTDADWNTMISQFSRHMQAESLDTFGPSVVPRETPDGFLISGPADALEIGPGRIYVDGLQAENHTESLKWDARLAEISGTAKLSGANLDASPTGLTGTTAYDDQPYYPNPPALPANETYLAYVDVWQRDITYLQDASLVDAAVGVDTTARQQTIWQVKFLDDVGALDPTVDDVDIPGWLKTIHPSSARLTTTTGNLPDDENPCLLPPQADYKGLENQLYRVQVHDGGSAETATFKWSRDNAVVSSRVSAISGGNVITVDSLGRDEVLSFHPGDWVEITDDYHDLMGLPGELRRIDVGDSIDSATRAITLQPGNPLPIGPGNDEFPIDGSNQTEPARNTRIIRWDQAGTVFNADETPYANLDEGGSSGAITIPTAGSRLFLDNGILVDFNLEATVDEADFEPEFKVGDYWIFSARVNDASIELLESAPPMGIHHHFAKLAIVNGDNITDCRTLWPPEVGGENCACTVCVHPESHNNGSATIQQAVDQVISQGGGTVCLSVGEYDISQTIRISGNSVSLRGQGWETRLIARRPIPLIDIGGETLVTDITVENIFAITSTTRSFNSAITVNNVIGLTLNDCFIANIAAPRSTSQGIQFTGLVAMAEINKCNLMAERGIVGPRLQDEYLGTMDFSVHDCAMVCSQQGIDFSGMSFHINKLDLLQNHISGCLRSGIELTGAVFDNSAVNIEKNLLLNCQNGIRSGLSNLRILCNDLEVEGDDRDTGDAIIFVDGLDPDDSANQQVIGNRIRNYRGHAITVQTGIGKMMVKQNQTENILGAAFVITASGSVDYLSLENNQFTDVDGIITEHKGHFSSIFLQANMRADISNNTFDRVVRSTQAASTRAGIMVTSSSDVRITGNRLFSVTPESYTGLGAGIVISSTVGHFDVSNNEVSRIPQNDDNANQNVTPATWLPLFVNGARVRNTDATTGAAATINRGFEDVRSFTGALATSFTLMESAPVVNVNNLAYAVLATNMVNLGAAALANNSMAANGNKLDGTSSTTVSVVISVAMHCAFMNNEVTSLNPGTLVILSADHVGANNNRMVTTDDQDILIVKSSRYVLMGNMSTGFIVISSGGTTTQPTEPWKSLNIII